MKLITLSSTLGVLAFAAISFGADSALAASSIPEATSENWAGYVAAPSNGGSFSRVTGSWVQPAADANGGDGDSAFWVGIGGSGQSQSQSQTLEQIGTQADVSNGKTTYFAWYELVPRAPVNLSLKINPGDHVSASVAVSGSNVTVSLTNQTTGASFTRTLQMSNPDTSSAEWIAEAPSTVFGDGTTQTIPLADFGKVQFTGAAATANAQTGTISDWGPQAIQLNGSGAGAQPTSLSGDGSSFSVFWQGSSLATSTSSPGNGYGGAGSYSYGGDGGYGDGGYGYSDPYGDGGDYGYADPYGYGGYGYDDGSGYYAPSGYAYGY